MKSVKRAARGEKLSYSVQYLGKTGAARSSIGRCEGQREKEYEVGMSSCMRPNTTAPFCSR